MDAIAPLDDEERQAGYAGLVGLILGLVLGGAVLYVVSGPPHLPAHVPSWNTISTTLTGSYLPLGVLAYILTMLAWAVWFWIVASLGLQLLAATAEVASHGAAWARTFGSISDRLTLPIVRRAVDGALIATFVVNMVSRTIPGAVAASPPPVSTPHVASMRSHPRPTTSTPDHEDGKHPLSAEYTVQLGDTLWGIAEQFYGTGYEFPRLVEANAGRLMPDGQRFTRAGVIQPGWVLRIPLPSDRVHEADGRSSYIVEEGDTLRGIAARLLGNEERWTALFDLNRDRARVDGHVLTDPDLIWPGLRLQLPHPPPQVAAPGRARAGGPEHPERPRAPTPSPTSTNPQPTPTSATQTSLPEPVARTPAAVPTSTVASRPASQHPDDDLWLPYGAAGAAVMAAGAGALFLRRRVRRSLSEPPIPIPKVAPPPGDDFLESQPGRTLAHRLHSGEREPAVVVAEQACHFLAEHGLQRVSVIWAEQGRNVVTLLLSAGPQEQGHILDLAEEIRARLGGKGRAVVTPDRDIALQVAGLQGARLMASRTQPPASLPLVPLGVLSGGEVLSANWGELGHVLVAGMPYEGTDVLLTSLLAALTARRSPTTLRLWTIADRRTLPAQLQSLPHQCCGIVDPTDNDQVEEVLTHLRTELSRRMRDSGRDQRGRWQPSAEEPETLLVVGELSDLSDDGTTLAMIATRGPEYGVRLVAATTRAEAVADDVLSYFETRLVLQTFDGNASMRVLGQPEAADLGDGEFFLRIGTRRALRLRGFRVAPDHLDELLRLMGEAYGERGARWPARSESDTRDVGAPPADASESRDEAPGTFAEPEEAQPPNGHPATVATIDVGVEEESDLGGEGLDAGAGTQAVIQIRCFGDFVVTSGDKEITSSGEEGASYRAWELLAYLAAQPDPCVSRDKVLAAIWAAIDTEQGRGRVRTAMRRLRDVFAYQISDLPAEVARTDRNGMCRLNTTLATSDVQQFVSLLRRAEKLPPEEAKRALEEAHALYRGDLLSGYGARYYEWVEERNESGVSLREYYREEYRRATQRLARLYCEEGHPELAVPLYKEILKAEPTLEDVVRKLYRCYARLCDLTSLIREDWHLRQALREEYADLGGPKANAADYQPEPETVALFQEIRAELEDRAAQGNAAQPRDHGTVEEQGRRS